ncbi:MAG: TetR/AcrR family transcriptional regulator [Elusimicrobiales bacterium]|nr:TetR/AcrR family transcriptional regulator [Elusimicrobiales bacterium]
MRRSDPAKADIVRDEILRAALGLFQTYGLDKTTMEDIAEAAGKGKSTLYYYFKKKEDVFHTVARQEMDSILETLEKGLKWTHSAGEKLRLFFQIQDNAIRNKAKLYPLIFKETKKHVAMFHSIQRESNTREIKLLKSILLEGIASGEFKGIKKEQCDAIALAGVTTLHATHLNLLLEGKTPSAEDKLAVMVDIFIKGLK